MTYLKKLHYYLVASILVKSEIRDKFSSLKKIYDTQNTEIRGYKFISVC